MYESKSLNIISVRRRCYFLSFGMYSFE